MKFTGKQNTVATDDLKAAGNTALVPEPPPLGHAEPGTGTHVLP